LSITGAGGANRRERARARMLAGRRGWCISTLRNSVATVRADPPHAAVQLPEDFPNGGHGARDLLSLDEPSDNKEEMAKSLVGPVSVIEHGGDEIRSVLQAGHTLSFDVVYPALGCGVRSELAVAWALR
jgi:hypothetical protein